jgi:hypothetical protein
VLLFNDWDVISCFKRSEPKLRCITVNTLDIHSIVHGNTCIIVDIVKIIHSSPVDNLFVFIIPDLIRWGEGFLFFMCMCGCVCCVRLIT